MSTVFNVMEQFLKSFDELDTIAHEAQKGLAEETIKKPLIKPLLLQKLTELAKNANHLNQVSTLVEKLQCPIQIHKTPTL